jgi:hypothetical protein
MIPVQTRDQVKEARNMPQTLYQLYRVIGTMQVSGNQAGVGQSINFSFDLYYGNAQQNNGIPEIVGKPVVTSFGPLGKFEIQGTGVEIDNLVRFRSPIAEIDLLFTELTTIPPSTAPPPQVVNRASGSELYSCNTGSNEPCASFPPPGVFTTGTSCGQVYEHQTPDLPIPYVGPSFG